VAQNDVRLSDMEVRLNAVELTTYDGTLMWKITEVVRRRKEAVSGDVLSIQSPAFYTSRTGQLHTIVIVIIIIIIIIIIMQ